MLYPHPVTGKKYFILRPKDFGASWMITDSSNDLETITRLFNKQVAEYPDKYWVLSASIENSVEP